MARELDVAPPRVAARVGRESQSWLGLIHDTCAIGTAAQAMFQRKGRGNVGAGRALMGGPVPRTASVGWSVRIEMDNLDRHEWPICTEAGIPQRLTHTSLAKV